jgi:hypothetical protein
MIGTYSPTTSSKRAMTEPSANKKVMTDEKSRLKLSATGGGKTRSSPYRQTVALDGLKQIQGDLGSRSRSRTLTVLSEGETRKIPETNACVPVDGTTSDAWTFVDSVTSLCRRSSTCCGPSSIPPMEDIFLFLVRRSGLHEAMRWAKFLEVENTRSYILLSALLCASSSEIDQT